MESPSPRPLPIGFVVMNGSKMRSITSGGMPGPLSAMRMRTVSCAARTSMSIAGSLDIGHRIERVGDEVDQHLLELHRISRHPQARLDIAREPHARRLDLALHQEQRAVDRASDLDLLKPSGLALAREGFQVRGDVGHALGQPVDEVEIVGDLP